MAFQPVNEDHGIARVSVVITLKDQLKGDFEVMAYAVKKQNDTLVHFAPMITQSVKFNESKISQSEPVQIGFLISDDLNTPTETWRGLNEANRNVLIYISSHYDRWKPFFVRFSQVFNDTLAHIERSRVLAIGLEYVDQFTWVGNPNGFSWSELFKNETDMLSNDFFDHTHLQYSVLRNRSVKKLDNVTEQLEILRINYDSARIRHHVSVLLNHEHLTTTQPDSKTFFQKLKTSISLISWS